MARFNLPDIDFVAVDPAELENLAVSKFEEIQKISLDDADPRRKFIQSMVYVATILANNIDFTGKQNLLAYSVDNYLDHIGIRKNVPRLEPTAATTTFRFEVESPEDFTITAGKRFSINDIFFVTTEDKFIPIGTITVDIAGTCEQTGIVGNGYLPNQITNLVDPIPWVSKAYNITTTSGGTDLEDDDAYAERIRQSNAQFSTAGSEESYIYHVKSANASIIDVSVTSPSIGEILIVFLLENGGIPSDTLVSQISGKVSDKTVRPLTDHVTVQKPVEVSYDIDVTYYVSSEKESVLQSIQSAINQAVTDYQVWQKSKLGRGIDASELNSRIVAAGGRRITIVSPASYVALQKNEVAKANIVNVTYGGLIYD